MLIGQRWIMLLTACLIFTTGGCRHSAPDIAVVEEVLREPLLKTCTFAGHTLPREAVELENLIVTDMRERKIGEQYVYDVTANATVMVVKDIKEISEIYAKNGKIGSVNPVFIAHIDRMLSAGGGGANLPFGKGGSLVYRMRASLVEKDGSYIVIDGSVIPR